jgi:E3 ubiquitin-protein ligase HUWE1
LIFFNSEKLLTPGYHLKFLYRQQRIRNRAQAAVTVQETQQVSDVNPEFLAALPLNIQEEVLAQQRQEQQRQAAAAANPNDPVNAAEFFQNLQPSLRQAVSLIQFLKNSS